MLVFRKILRTYYMNDAYVETSQRIVFPLAHFATVFCGKGER